MAVTPGSSCCVLGKSSLKCSESVWCAPAGTHLKCPNDSPGAWQRDLLQLYVTHSFVPEDLFQRHRNSSPQLENLEVFGTKNHPPWQRGFPWVPSRDGSSTRKQERGVAAFISNRWSEKRCEGAIWEQKHWAGTWTGQTGWAQSTGIEKFHRMKVGKTPTLNKDFFVLLSILIYKNCFLILLENVASFEVQQDPCRGLVWSCGDETSPDSPGIMSSVVPRVGCSAQLPGCFPSFLQLLTPKKADFAEFHTHSDKYWLQLQLKGVGTPGWSDSVFTPLPIENAKGFGVSLSSSTTFS